MKSFAIFFAVFVAVRTSCSPGTLPDPQSPTIRCPADIMITSSHKAVKVTWKSPIAVDNSGLTPTITCSNNVNRTILRNPGELTVNCTATDDAGNIATCSFKITVEGPSCPFDPYPSNGILACTDVPSPTLRKVCMLACNDRYDFEWHPGLLYVCLKRRSNYLIWPVGLTNPINATSPWPNCTVKSSPVQKSFPHPEYYYKGDPSAPCVKHIIKTNFIKAISTFIPSNKLGVEDIQVYPGDAEITLK